MNNSEEEYYKLVVVDNFISIFGTNVDFLDDREVIENRIMEYLNSSNGKEGLKGVYSYCLKVKNHEYPIEDWYDFVDDGFYEVTPDTMHDTHTAKGCYDWFCDMVKLFADILYEHGIITEEEKQLAYVETKLEQKDAEVKRR